MPVAISVENLSKKYLISHQKKERYTALRDVIAGNAKALSRRLLRPCSGVATLIEDARGREEFWALKDINLEIQQGDRVGIIGRNGAGKSTLLKILSRITEPTMGRVKIKGRVASLLEVGTGFHPELTGRENIFLNGAIMGMSKAEIGKRFDEIVAFAEVDQFLDVPVKRYSSGMYVRLAFAVAAHLEADVLLLDEVLAVGDVQFQNKCLGKIAEIGQMGKTILFVSHNLSAVGGLCGKGLLLTRGSAEYFQDVGECLSQYHRQNMEQSAEIVALDTQERPPEFHLRQCAKFLSAKMSNEGVCGLWQLQFPAVPAFAFSVEITEPLSGLELGIALYDQRGVEVASSLSSDHVTFDLVKPGLIGISATYQDLILLPGAYSLGLGLQSEFGIEDYLPNAISFEILSSEEAGRAKAHLRKGVFIPQVAYRLSNG